MSEEIINLISSLNHTYFCERIALILLYITIVLMFTYLIFPLISEILDEKEDKIIKKLDNEIEKEEKELEMLKTETSKEDYEREKEILSKKLLKRNLIEGISGTLDTITDVLSIVLIFLVPISILFSTIISGINDNKFQKVNDYFKDKTVIIRQDDSYVIKGYYELKRNRTNTRIELHASVLNFKDKDVENAIIKNNNTNSRVDNIYLKSYEYVDVILEEDTNYDENLKIEIIEE